ncbi:MAG: response regulator [Steroidobacteraceae bacterium]
MTTRLILVDDHAIFREALRMMLRAETDIEVVGEAGNGREAIDLARELSPDIIVLDVGMPDMNGIEATAAIVDRSPQIKVIALSTHSDRRFVAEMIKAGASGYVVKTAASSELLRAIRAVAQGQSYLCPQVAAGVMRASTEDPQRRRSGPPELTRREREVLKLLAEGLRTASIAARMHLAPSTVEVHRRNLMRKLDLHSVADLTKYALREGLTEL